MSVSEGGLEVPLHNRPEEVQGEHVEEQVPPASMDETITEHPMPLFPVPDIVGVELERVAVQRPVEAEDTDAGRYQYDDESNHDRIQI